MFVFVNWSRIISFRQKFLTKNKEVLRYESYSGCAGFVTCCIKFGWLIIQTIWMKDWWAKMQIGGKYKNPTSWIKFKSISCSQWGFESSPSALIGTKRKHCLIHWWHKLLVTARLSYWATIGRSRFGGGASEWSVTKMVSNAFCSPATWIIEK